MATRVTAGPISSDASIREAVSIHTKKIYDSCRDKDCLEDIRVYLTAQSQQLIENAVSVRAKSAELIYASIDVKPVTFNRGFYSVDIRFFYKITGEAYAVINNPSEIVGLAVCDKRVILFGSEGNAKIFSSDTNLGASTATNLPRAVLEAVDPIALSMKLVDAGTCQQLDSECVELPQFLCQHFSDRLFSESTDKRVYVTLGQFSIIRLERDSQLTIPVYDYCMPEKECVVGSNDDPCSLFSRITFPVDEFFPPDSLCGCEDYRDAIECCNQ